MPAPEPSVSTGGNMKKFNLLVCFALLCSATGLAQAQSFEVLNIIGYMYESDNTPGTPGFPPSDAGDVLAGIGFVDNISHPLTWSTADYEYTWVIDGLVSMGQIDLGGGVIRVYYTGGTIDIIADRYLDTGYTMPFYGVDPPDAGAIGSFSNGDAYLSGVFTQFVLTYNTTNFSGNYQGAVTFTLGTNYGELGDMLANPDGMAIAGLVGVGADSTIPEGYDCEADGSIYYDPTIPNEDTTFSNLKNLYR